MIGTTVTMSLERYKELEATEKAFNKMVTSKEVVIIQVPYGNIYYFDASLQQAFEYINKDIERMSEYAEEWRKKANK